MLAQGYSFTAVADLNDIRVKTHVLGTIAGEVIVPPRFGFSVVRTEPNTFKLAVCKDGSASIVDSNMSLRGLAASGSRVLYFKQTAQSGTDVMVYDANTGEKIFLGHGDYYYPYLVKNGSIAVVAAIDWTSGLMSVYSARVAAGNQLYPILEGVKIGSLRVADDGRGYAYLGPAGLKLGCTLVSSATDFNVDCVTDFTDFAIFASHWLEGVEQ